LLVAEVIVKPLSVLGSHTDIIILQNIDACIYTQ